MRRPVIPKVRQAASITLNSGVVMQGYFYVEATSRIQDVLNNETLFIPFLDENDVLHLISKTAIAEVFPYD